MNACYALAVQQVAVEHNYELASEKLAKLQFIIIDKEFLPPQPGVNVIVKSKLMDPIVNPLISYYRGA